MNERILEAQRFSLASFFPIFDRYIYALVSDEASIFHATTCVIQDFAADGARYLELRTTPRAVLSAGLSKESYVSIVLRAINDFHTSTVNQTEHSRLHTRLILSVDRKNTLQEAQEVVELALKYAHLGVVGVDLCGNPTRRPVSHLRPAFERARAGGLPITLHFAEISQESTEELDNMLSWKPRRLGHVIHVPEEMRQEIMKKKLGLELCLSCNVLANLSEGGFEAHHFGEWWRNGASIALSTDDVGIFESPLSNEYLLAARHFSLDRRDLVMLSKGAVDTIFGGQAEKERMLTLLDEFQAQYGLF